MAENLQTIEETAARTRQTRPLLRKALAVVGVAAAFGSASPAMAAASAGASGAHEAAAHKAPHKKAVAETPVQKALKSDLINFAGQIITDFNNGKSNPQVQAVKSNAACYDNSSNGYGGPGQEYFCINVPFTDAPVQGLYHFSAALDYPEKLIENPPSTPNLNYAAHVSLQVGVPATESTPGGLYQFQADTDFNSATATNPNAGCVQQSLWTSTVEDNWEYETAPSTLCDEGGKQVARLTMAELQTEAGIMQTMLNNAAQFTVPPVSLALASQMPAPNLK